MLGIACFCLLIQYCNIDTATLLFWNCSVTVELLQQKYCISTISSVATQSLRGRNRMCGRQVHISAVRQGQRSKGTTQVLSFPLQHDCVIQDNVQLKLSAVYQLPHKLWPNLAEIQRALLVLVLKLNTPTFLRRVGPGRELPSRTGCIVRAFWHTHHDIGCPSHPRVPPWGGSKCRLGANLSSQHSLEEIIPAPTLSFVWVRYPIMTKKIPR